MCPPLTLLPIPPSNLSLIPPLNLPSTDPSIEPLTNPTVCQMDRLPKQLPKQLLVSAPVGGRRTAGGQKRRWSDLVSNDLKQCNLSRSWREQAQECDSWRATIRHRVELLNKQAEYKEKACKDEQKRVLYTATILAALFKLGIRQV